ncbi:MAG TPA: Fe-S cluster assembly protein SufD [Sphingobacteriaceae bacterium]|nr:Fe-S cluster assembly protein SufD [Sphingobacteriaceae bacterium]
MMITQVSDTLYTKLLLAFDEKATLGQYGLGTVREQAAERFKSLGFPTVKQEDWKHTQLHSVLNKNLVLGQVEEARVSADDLAGLAIPALDAYRIVLINGRFEAELSDAIQVDGVTVKELNEAYGEELFEKHFAQYADKTDNPFVALNTALVNTGVFIHIANKVKLDKPIHLIRLVTAQEPAFTLSRNLFVLDAFAEAELVESLVGVEGVAETLNNQVTEISMAENAKLQHYMIQTSAENASYVSHIEVHQRKHSLYNNYNANFPGSRFVRHDINVRMDDPEVESHLYGVVLLDKNQFVDNHTIVDHMMPHGESYEWYKTMTQDASTAVFNGKIFVRLDAQKTNAFQQNNNVLLGDKSTVYSKPQLEIFADDVKCSHGCTIGEFDEESLFYLRARGLGEETARTLLVQAFAFDVTSRFDNEAVRKSVEHLISASLN